MTKPLVSTKYRWRTRVTRRRVPLGLTLQCFATSHSSSFVVRFQRISIVGSSVVVSQLLREASLSTSCVALQGDDIDLCQGESNHKCVRGECIRDTCSNHQQSCMPFLIESNKNKDASREHQCREIPINYIYVGTTFSFVWAWFMIRKEGRFLETRNLERNLVLRVRQDVTKNTITLRTWGIERCSRCSRDWVDRASVCLGCSRNWANRASACSRCSRDWANWAIKRSLVYICFELDTFLKSCSIHLNYLVIAFIAKAYVISYCPRTIVPWQTSPLDQTQVILIPWKEGDLTLNVKETFVQKEFMRIWAI